MKRPANRESGFTLIEAILALVILSMGVVSLLVIRDRALEGAHKTRLHRAAVRLASDIAARIEAGVLDGDPELEKIGGGVYINNRDRTRRPVSDGLHIEYPAYPENEEEPTYPPGLKFEYEITAEGTAAEQLPSLFAEDDQETLQRYEQRWDLEQARQNELENSSDFLEEETEEDEEKTEELRTLTVFVRFDFATKKNVLLFELQREFLWTYPEREGLVDDEATGGAGGEGSTPTGR